jgi:RNA polymerase sigma-70 factor (ECF subfamily)
MPDIGEVHWLQPYPDRLLDAANPEAEAIERETIELTFIAAVQLLPPRQRATLLIRDVLGWSAAETAETLGTSVRLGQQHASAGACNLAAPSASQSGRLGSRRNVK